MDPVSSTTFIKKPPCMTDLQENFLYTKDLLSGRIFLGCYQERRYVSVLQEYRDVVILSPEETDFHHDINKILKKWWGSKDLKWVGITGPDSIVMPKVCCFWVKLTNLAFGCYWFQIKRVKLSEKEIELQLKCIRKSHAPLIAITSQVIKKEEITDEKYEKGETSISKGAVWEFDSKKALQTFQEKCTRTIHLAQPLVTCRNIFFIIKFTCALVIALVMGIISLIGHLGEYSLKLIREFTLLVNAFTPIVIQLIDFLTKVVGGLYILLAGMFIRNQNPPHINPYRNDNLYSVTYPNAGKPPQTLAVDWRERNRILRQELFNSNNRN